LHRALAIVPGLGRSFIVVRSGHGAASNAQAVDPGERSTHAGGRRQGLHRPGHSTWRTLLAVSLLAVPQPQLQAADSAAQSPLQSWVTQASSGLDTRAIVTLQKIIGADRRLLALRAYLRAGSSLAQRWSWTKQQITAYPNTAEGKAAAGELQAVAAAFAAKNPGFTLIVNRVPRSLELQVTHWNENASVGNAAAALTRALEQKFPDPPRGVSADQLRSALIQWRPSVPVALAAPGLSAHGQARAFDFQVEHQGRIVAGPDFASAARQWDAAGWTAKLHAAVGAAGNHFVGPLASPREPWHYNYIGKAAAR
jgi:hypothetical protein